MLYVWIKESHHKEVTEQGFTIKKGCGRDRFFVESRDSPFDPTSAIHLVPTEAIEDVTIRIKAQAGIMPGLYQHVYSVSYAKMLVRRERIRGIQIVRRILNMINPMQDIRIRAGNIHEAKRIFMEASNNVISPDKVCGGEIIAMFD